MLLGEARSKCQHLAGTPLRPEIAEALYLVTLVRGAHATTAIEGNTLSEEQVEGILKGSFKAPPSRAYQEVEVRNVLDALRGIADRIQQGEYPKLSAELICDFNGQILHGLEDQLDDQTIPGSLRRHSVGVGLYRGAPAEDCAYLLDRLCEWLEGPDFTSPDTEIDYGLMLARAVLAHLYIAWIHPFGEGNGRTARLVEFMILARSGKVPLPGAHLLSNHYNLTRDRYYRELDRASRSGGDILGFVNYAIEGFVDGIRVEIGTVRDEQLRAMWINLIHERMATLPAGRARDRQRALILAMPRDSAVSRGELTGLTPELASLYATAGPRTLARDLNRLQQLGLLVRDRKEYRGNIAQLAAFLPPMADPGGDR